ESADNFVLFVGFRYMVMMWVGFISSPHVYLMFMWSKSGQLAQRSAALATTYLAIFYTVLFIVGAYIIATQTDLLQPDMGYFEVLDHLPAIFIGLFVAAVLAAAMSTADAQLLNATSAITNDLYQAVKGKPIREERSVLINRIVVLIIGAIAIVVALDPPDLIVWLLAVAHTLMIGAFFTPFLLGLLWERATATDAHMGVIVRFASAVVAQFLPMPNEFVEEPITGPLSLITNVIVT